MDALHREVKNTNDLTILEDGTIKCISTEHEFGNINKITDQNKVIHLIKQYFNGSKYKMKQQYLAASNMDQYENVVPHRRNDKKVYCTICKQDLNRLGKQIQDHINGRKHKFRVLEKQKPKVVEEEKDDDFEFTTFDNEDSQEEEEDGEEVSEMQVDESFEIVPQTENEEDQNQEDDEDDETFFNNLIKRKAPASFKQSPKKKMKKQYVNQSRKK